jgi:hypothetical protein
LEQPIVGGELGGAIFDSMAARCEARVAATAGGVISSGVASSQGVLSSSGVVL